VPYDESSDANFESQKKRKSQVREDQKFDKSKSYINLDLNMDDSHNRSRRQ